MKTTTVCIIALIIFGFNLPGDLQAASKNEASSPYVLRWVMAHKPERFFVSTGEHFKKLVEKRSNQKIQVQIITDVLKESNEERIPYLRKEALEKIISNEYEMTQIYTYALNQFAPEMDVLDLPYLFSSDAHVTNVVEGPIGIDLLNKINNGPVKALAFTYSGGFLAIPSKNKELRRISDFKGLKYSPWPGIISHKVTEKLGATFVKYNFSDNSTPAGKAQSEFKFLDDLFKDNTVDIGDLSCGDVIEYISNSDQIKIINNVGYRVILTSLVMNKTFYNSLPDDLQKVIDESAVEAARFERDLIIDECNKVNALAEVSKIKKVNFIEKTAFEDLMAPIKNEVLDSDAKKLLYEKIKQTGDNRIQSKNN